MRIGQYEIPKIVIEKCLERMKNEPFRAGDIKKAAVSAGCLCTDDAVFYPEHVACRLIQRERLAKNIKSVNYPIWQWVGTSKGGKL